MSIHKHSFQHSSVRSTSFSRHSSSNDNDNDPQDVYFPPPRLYHDSSTSLHRRSQSLPPLDLQHRNFLDLSEDEEQRFAPVWREKMPLRLGGGFSFPHRLSAFPPPPYSPYSASLPGRDSVLSLDGGWRNRQDIKIDVVLAKGHFIAAYPVPTAVHNAIESHYRMAHSTEFSHMRYTAATCDPDDFTEENGWSLRTKMYERSTEILIAVTSYKEDRTLYTCTLHSIMMNVRDICKTKSSKYWRSCAEAGTPGWQKIVVALIADGLEAMDKSILDVLATVGVYHDGVMKKQVDGKDTVAHIFEYTTQLSVDAKSQLVLPQEGDENNLVPVQIIFIVKAKNQKKINSHRWLFNGIGRHLRPEVCVLIDADTKPGPKSIYYLWEAFYNDPNLGGCAGELQVMLNGGKKLLNPLVAAQNFEYKLSNIFDKPLESNFGYVSVLPGAFSAYRYRAILGRPLEQYFHGDHSLAERLGDKGINGMSIFQKNMFLAEDRILSFELVVKTNCKWTLTYVKPSKAETEVPESAAELIRQRRRWLNGSFAASVYALVNFFRIYRSNHGFIRISFFHVQALYNAFSLFFSWFSLANMWLTFSVIIDLLPSESPVFGSVVFFHWFNMALKWTYMAFLVLQFKLALGNGLKNEPSANTVTLWVYAVLAIYLLLCSLWLAGFAFSAIPRVIRNSQGNSSILLTLLEGPLGPLAAATVFTFGVWFIASMLYNDPWHMITSFFQYLCLAPSFVNVLNVYAFCNLHDVSWGTRGCVKVGTLPSIKSTTSLGSNRPAVEYTEKFQEEVNRSLNKTDTRTLTKTESSEAREKPTLDDEDMTFRNRLVTTWMLTNAILAFGIENIDGWLYIDDSRNSKGMIKTWEQDMVRKRNASLLYATIQVGITSVKFIGCFYYLLRRNLLRCCRRT